MNITQETKYKIAIIGLGEVAQLMHIPILKRFPDKFLITGIYDISQKLMNYISQQYNIANKFNSAEELIKSETNNIIFVLSPDQYHYQYAILALAHKKHLFVEKPVCLLQSHAEKLFNKYQEVKDLVGFVGYMRRYAEPFLMLKKMIKDKTIEYVRIRDIICEGTFFIKQSNNIYYPDDLQKQFLQEGKELLTSQLEQACNGSKDKIIHRAYQVLTGLSSHSFSAMRELLGLPESVINVSIQKNGTMIIILFNYKNFYVNYECLIHDVVHFDASIEIMTNNEHFALQYNTPYVRNLPMSLYVTQSNDSSSQTIQMGPYFSDPFVSELHEFYNCLENKLQPKTNFLDSLEDFKIFKKVMEKIK